MTLAIASAAARFAPRYNKAIGKVTRLQRNRFLATIAPGVDFDTVAREWRCKWSAGNDKASLAAAQQALDSVLAEVKAVDGVTKVDRVVCGGCLDFKVITSMPAGATFEAWQGNQFAPEETFLGKLKAIDGISAVETQTYTIMPM